jgi:DnaJ like chaperone protein
MDSPQKIPAKPPFPFPAPGRFAGFLPGALAGIIGGILGAPAGIAGSITGAFAGALLGVLLQQAILRRRSDRKVTRYFEAPGKVDFDEGPAGLSAYCALGTILVALSVREAEPNPLFRRGPAGETAPGAGLGKSHDGELISRRVIHSAQEVFPGSASARALMEAFCRIALSMPDRLNPDLLAESLAARRGAAGDLERLGQELESLAQGDRALREAASIRQTLRQGAYRKPTRQAEG